MNKIIIMEQICQDLQIINIIFFFGENIPYASLDDSGVQQPVEL